MHITDSLFGPRRARDGLLLGLAYFVAAALFAGLARFGGGVAFIWLANAILMATLQMTPRRAWALPILICAAASFVATAAFGLGLAAAVPLAFVNMLEAAAGAVMLSWITRGRISLSSGEEIGGLIAVAIGAASTTAFAGAAVAHYVTGQPYWTNWITWTSGHALGTVAVTPLIFLLLGGDVAGWFRAATRYERWEALALFALMSGVSVIAFAQSRVPLLFLPFLPMMMCVFRMGRVGAAGSMILLTAISAGFTVRDVGPVHFLHAAGGMRAQFLNFYLAVATLMVLPAAAELKRRKSLYSKLQESAAIYSMIADRTGDVLMTTARDGAIRYVSPSLIALTGFTPEQMLGKSAADLIFDADHGAADAAYLRALSRPEETVLLEHRVRRADGSIGWFETHIRAIVGDDGASTGAVSIVREISKRKAREADLRAAASTDPLTGVANRRSFEKAFSRLRSTRKEEPVGCLALFDLDHFKRVNDRYGHAAGDQALKAFSAILAKGVRSGDSVARLGGEEFAALLVDADLQQAKAVCERIRRSLEETRLSTPIGAPLALTVSVGLSPIRAAVSLESVMMAADAALYEAKSGGRNQIAVVTASAAQEEIPLSNG